MLAGTVHVNTKLPDHLPDNTDLNLRILLAMFSLRQRTVCSITVSNPEVMKFEFNRESGSTYFEHL